MRCLCSITECKCSKESAGSDLVLRNGSPAPRFGIGSSCVTLGREQAN